MNNFPKKSTNPLINGYYKYRENVHFLGIHFACLKRRYRAFLAIGKGYPMRPKTISQKCIQFPC
jgi:hypothetical protein